MIIAYRLIVLLYGALLRMAAWFHPKAKLFVEGRKNLNQRIRYAMLQEQRPVIWMHCASLGEFEQGRPVLEALRARYPQYALVLTFFSPSGYEVRKNYSGADYVFYLPLDSKANARSFMDSVRPSLCLFVKYDLWYDLLTEIWKRDVPLLLISAIFRREHGFFKWYGGLQRSMLACFTHIFVQDEASRILLNQIGFDQVSVSGDTRFDRVAEAAAHAAPVEGLERFTRNARILVAGSTWPADERLLQQALGSLPAHWKLIVVPHEVDEGHIRSILNLFGDQAVLWSRLEEPEGKRVLILDRVGMLMQVYASAHLAWVGGGFGRAGIHNVLEPAAYGVPVLFGPQHHKFREAAGLIASGGGKSLSDAAALVHAIRQWEDERESYEAASAAARHFVQRHAGATGIVLRYLSEKNWLIR